MSKERIGKNGRVVGTAAYFEELNKNSMFAGIFTNAGDHHYWDQLSGLAGRVSDALNELCEDLKSHAQVLPYISENLRNETADFVKGIDGICKFMKTGRTKADTCLSYLYLRDFNTRPKSRADKKEIIAAVAQIRKQSSMWQFDLEKMLQKAQSYGLRNLSGDEKKISFIKGLYKEDKNFYADVLLLLRYQNHPDQFKGKGGQTLCTKEYISYFKSKLGLSNIPMRYLPKGGTYEYAENIKYTLNSILDIIRTDLFANGQYLSVENINKLKLVSDDMIKLIGKGFEDKFKSALTDVVNVDGLMIDRDYQVLSGDDLALVKALNNEYLWFEQQGLQTEMYGIAAYVVKIRQKPEYYDQYNRGPYLDVHNYEEKAGGKIDIIINVMSTGFAGLNGGDVYSPAEDVLSGAVMDASDKVVKLSPKSKMGVFGFLDVLLLLSSLPEEERVKHVLREEDIYIRIYSWENLLEKISYYKRDGTLVVFDFHDSKDTKNKGKYKDLEHVLNPDMAMTPLWKEFLEGAVPWYGTPIYQAILDKIYEEKD